MAAENLTRVLYPDDSTEAGRALKEPWYTERAVRAAEFVLQKQKTKDGRLLRTYGAQPGQKAEARVNAYLEDYAFLVHGLLKLHDVTGDKKLAKCAHEAAQRPHLETVFTHDAGLGLVIDRGSLGL